MILLNYRLRWVSTEHFRFLAVRRNEWLAGHRVRQRHETTRLRNVSDVSFRTRDVSTASKK